MRVKSASGFHPHALPSLLLVAALIATWIAYAPGIGGTFYFDDQANLQGLESVHDSTSAFQFVASGYSGPLGRPLALASFVPEAHAWPIYTEVFLRTNILIHLLNGVLLTWLLYLLSRAREQPEELAALIAVNAAAIWMLMPLLASSSLMIVQRMTTLSATWLLMGAIAYFLARLALDRHALLAMVGMTAALLVGTVLAVLTKETGVMLILFVLAAEATLLKRPTSVSRPLWRIWFGVVLLAPLVALLTYLASVVPYSEDLVLRRGFTAFERLLTQSEILWKYLYLAFLPNVANLGPFHDHHPVTTGLLNIVTLLSVGGWLVIIAAAIFLRRKAPLFSFAVAWYVLGHLLESTVLNLELYFEHRNYLPIVGPIYAVVASLHNLTARWRRAAAVVTAAYAGILGLILYSMTSLWGSPTIAAEMWHVYNPASLRATYHLADRIKREGYSSASRRLLNEYIDKNPDEYGIALEVLALSCELEPDADHGEAIQTIVETLPRVKFSFSAALGFQRLYELVRTARCSSIDYSALHVIGHSLLDSIGSSAPTVRHNVYVTMARMAMDQGDFNTTMTYIQEALRVDANPNTLWLAIGIAYSGGRNDIAMELFTEAKSRSLPVGPLHSLHWREELNRMEEFLMNTAQMPTLSE